MKKRILFIINPISGTGRQESAPEVITGHIDTARYDYEIRLTEYAGHATTLAKDAVRAGVDTVVAVGGDGTVNEVARAVVHTPTALGIIPCGSGNGLARHLQLPQNARRAVEIINQDVVHCLDYGRMNGHPFFCTCGVGFDALVSSKFAESKRRGVLSYVKDAVSVSIKHKPEAYTIRSESGEEQTEALLITCANASQYGSNAYIAPGASMKDGLLDVIIVKPFRTFEAAQLAFQMFSKTLHSNSHVETFRTDHLHITREAEGVAHCDGDPILLGREIDIVLLRRSFNVVVNPEASSSRRGLLQELVGNATLALRPYIPTLREAPAHDDDPFALSRFVKAQAGVFDCVRDELRRGQKRTHWMWYIFPQLSGLGRSSMSRRYAISGREEAVAFLAHPVLGNHLRELCRLLLETEGRSAHEIFGSPDDWKLRSCMTLFSSVAEDGSIFQKVLEKYYDGRPCSRTLRRLADVDASAETGDESSTN